MDGCVLRYAHAFEIVSQDADRLCVLFEEFHVFCAAAERFDAKSAGSREKICHNQAFEALWEVPRNE